MKVNIQYCICILFLIAVADIALASPIVWDFTKGQSVDAEGKYPLTLQGASQLGEDGLLVSDMQNDKPEGALTMKKTHPELTPQAFRFQDELWGRCNMVIRREDAGGNAE